MGTEAEREMVQLGRWTGGKRWVIAALWEFWTYNQYLGGTWGIRRRAAIGGRFLALLKCQQGTWRVASIPTPPRRGFSSTTPQCTSCFGRCERGKRQREKKTTTMWHCSRVLTGPFANIFYKPCNKDVNLGKDSFFISTSCPMCQNCFLVFVFGFWFGCYSEKLTHYIWLPCPHNELPFVTHSKGDLINTPGYINHRDVVQKHWIANEVVLVSSQKNPFFFFPCNEDRQWHWFFQWNSGHVASTQIQVHFEKRKTPTQIS